MDERVRERRRAVNRERGRRRAGWVALVIVSVIGLGAFVWLWTSDVFAVKRVTVTALEHVTEGAVADATAEARGVSLLRLSTKDIEESLLAQPYVKSVRLHRSFPDTLQVVLEEYEPAVCFQTPSGHRWVVADDGRVLEMRADTSTGLPLVIAESRLDLEPGGYLPAGLARVLAVRDELADPDIRGLLPELEKSVVSASGELTIWLAGATELRIGEPTELKRKLRVAGATIQEYSKDGTELEYVDVRAPDRVAVKKK